MEAVQIHYLHGIRQIPIYFKIYTDVNLNDLEPLFLEWVGKTKIYTAPSLCIFLMKKDRSIKALSDNQYLNLLLSKKKYKKYF